MNLVLFGHVCLYIPGRIASDLRRVARFMALGIEAVKDQLLNRLATHDVLVENPFEGYDIDMVIPHAIGVNGHDGAALADPQAIGEGAFDAVRIAQFVEAVGAGQFGKALLQRQSGVGRGTIAVDTNQDVPAIRSHRRGSGVRHSGTLLTNRTTKTYGWFSYVMGLSSPCRE